MPAATATSRRKAPSPAVLKQRRDLAEERLDLEIKLTPLYAEVARIDGELKKVATGCGEPFKEDFGAKGFVSASGAVAAELKGEVPVIQSESFLELPKGERTRLLKSGLVKIEEQWGKATNGRVTVKVH